MRWSWKLGRFAGIDTYVHASFLLLVGWAAWAAWSGAGTMLAVLLGVGAPVRGRAEGYRTDTMASEAFTALTPSDQQLATEFLDAYVDDERRRGVALMAAGGAALGVGVAAVVVGSIRLARGRRGATTAESARLHPRPRLGRHEVGLGLWLEF
ncbi:MAG: hypothetical protein KDK70_35130 [Myxococcales bacterium]|nr:hypothetical protein [Myxococcales bacterium]